MLFTHLVFSLEDIQSRAAILHKGVLHFHATHFLGMLSRVLNQGQSLTTVYIVCPVSHPWNITLFLKWCVYSGDRGEYSFKMLRKFVLMFLSLRLQTYPDLKSEHLHVVVFFTFFFLIMSMPSCYQLCTKVKLPGALRQWPYFQHKFLTLVISSCELF